MAANINDLITPIIAQRNVRANDLFIESVVYPDPNTGNRSPVSITVVDDDDDLYNNWTDETAVYISVYDANTNNRPILSTKRLFKSVRSGRVFSPLTPINQNAAGLADENIIRAGMIVRADINEAMFYDLFKALEGVLNPDGTSSVEGLPSDINPTKLEEVLSDFTVEDVSTITDYVDSTTVEVALFRQNSNVTLNNVTGLTYGATARDTGISSTDVRKLAIRVPADDDLVGRLNVSGNLSDNILSTTNRFKNLGTHGGYQYYIVLDSGRSSEHVFVASSSDIFKWQVKRPPTVTYNGDLVHDLGVSTFLHLEDVALTSYVGLEGQYIHIDSNHKLNATTLSIKPSEIDAVNSPAIDDIMAVDATDSTRFRYRTNDPKWADVRNKPNLISDVDHSLIATFTEPAAGTVNEYLIEGITIESNLPTEVIAVRPQDGTHKVEFTDNSGLYIGIRASIKSPIPSGYEIAPKNRAVNSGNRFPEDIFISKEDLENGNATGTSINFGIIQRTNGEFIINFAVKYFVKNGKVQIELRYGRAGQAPELSIELHTVRQVLSDSSTPVDVHGLPDGGKKGDLLNKSTDANGDDAWIAPKDVVLPDSRTVEEFVEEVNNDITTLKDATSDIEKGADPSSWSNVTDINNMALAVGDSFTLTQARAVSNWAVSVGSAASGKKILIRLPTATNQNSARYEIVSNTNSVHDYGVRYATFLGRSSDDAWKYFVSTASHNNVKIVRAQLTGDAAHDGTAKWRGELTQSKTYRQVKNIDKSSGNINVTADDNTSTLTHDITDDLQDTVDKSREMRSLFRPVVNKRVWVDVSDDKKAGWAKITNHAAAQLSDATAATYANDPIDAGSDDVIVFRTHKLRDDLFRSNFIKDGVHKTPTIHTTTDIGHLGSDKNWHYWELFTGAHDGVKGFKLQHSENDLIYEGEVKLPQPVEIIRDTSSGATRTITSAGDFAGWNWFLFKFVDSGGSPKDPLITGLIPRAMIPTDATKVQIPLIVDTTPGVLKLSNLTDDSIKMQLVGHTNYTNSGDSFEVYGLI